MRRSLNYGFVRSLLYAEGRDFEEQVRREMLYLITKARATCDLPQMSPYIAQTLNFFIIEPMSCHTEARQMIFKMIFEEDREFVLENYSFMQDKKFKSSEFIASVAYMFHNISSLLFTHRGFMETSDFPKMLDETIMETQRQILKVFPAIKVPWEVFLVLFRKKYLSPWNPARYSERITRANFGTGVDYITIP